MTITAEDREAIKQWNALLAKTLLAAFNRAVAAYDALTATRMVDVSAAGKALWERHKAHMGPVWYHPSEAWEGLPYGAQNEWKDLAQACAVAWNLPIKASEEGE